MTRRVLRTERECVFQRRARDAAKKLMIKRLQIKGLKANMKGTNANAPRERRHRVSESSSRETVKALAVKALLRLHYGSIKARVF